MKLLLFFTIVSLTLFDQFALIVGRFDFTQPAYETLVYAFALKAKDVDKTTDWESNLKKLFSLPAHLLRNRKIDSLEWMSDFVKVTNYNALINALNRIPTDYQANGPILDIIRTNLIPVRDGDPRIKDTYIRYFNQTIDEPVGRLFDGFVVAVEKFNKKKIKATRLKAVSDEYKNMTRKYNEISASLRTQLERTIMTRNAYALQFQLFQRKLKKYEPPSGRSDANKKNEDYDFDYLKMLQQVSADLSRKVAPLESAVNNVKLTLTQYIDQRILWAEYLLENPFNHAKKSSGLSCFGGSKVKE
ncbi:uncharacterized protein LOC116352591 [Contarinia nasturtii]|uniref:uncharacterized protein LOC116352591 n=1 Tax=Contarinia nasturtii TaxID=265458 RepID=UPI0012D493AA|nr:uncharacterized protein LOC116352591 [Contarinia nasturtii]